MEQDKQVTVGQVVRGVEKVAAIIAQHAEPLRAALTRLVAKHAEDLKAAQAWLVAANERVNTTTINLRDFSKLAQGLPLFPRHYFYHHEAVAEEPSPAPLEPKPAIGFKLPKENG